MKKIFTLLFSLKCIFSVAQVSENFSDGNFNSNPLWIGNDTAFQINLNGELQSKGPEASSIIYLSTLNTIALNCIWEFKLKLEFNPSTTNFARIFLTSDKSDLSTDLQGYFVQIGQSGTTPDSIKIYLKNGSTETLLFTGNSGCFASSTLNETRIRIRRTGNEWKVYSDCSGGFNFILEGSFESDIFNSSAYFGWVCDYNTTSRFDKYYLDDIFIIPLSGDTIAPHVQSFSIQDSLTAKVIFSEEIQQQGSMQFTLNGANLPASSLLFENDQSVSLQSPFPFQSKQSVSLHISEVFDYSSNPLVDTTLWLLYYEPQPYDVLIHEILPDPIPTAGLPLVEFVELYNRTDFPIQLKDWIFTDGATTSTLPDYLLQAKDYVILCIEDSIFLYDNLHTIGLSPFPSLNNDGEQLTLRDRYGKEIHNITYSSSWYPDSYHSDGGFTLEMKDAQNPCGGEENWGCSISENGGTPSSQNSINTVVSDNDPPQVEFVVAYSTNTIKIVFSEPINKSLNDLIIQVEGNDLETDSIWFSENSANEIWVLFKTDMDSNRLYFLTIKGIRDCCGKQIDENNQHPFGLNHEAIFGDLIINEILFNPFTDGVDFLEIKNISDKIIEMSSLQIFEYNIENNSISEFCLCYDEKRNIYPEQIVAIATQKKVIQRNYTTTCSSCIWNQNNLPNFPDEGGRLALKKQDGATIDSLSYSEKWHSALLSDNESYSLERLCEKCETNDSSNWTSSSTFVRATPGYENSRQIKETGEQMLEVEPSVFSPDNDGFNDILSLSVNSGDKSIYGRLKLYDIEGRLEAIIFNQENLGGKNTYYWNGVNIQGAVSESGLYVAVLEVFDSGTFHKSYRKIFGVGGFK